MYVIFPLDIALTLSAISHYFYFYYELITFLSFILAFSSFCNPLDKKCFSLSFSSTSISACYFPLFLIIYFLLCISCSGGPLPEELLPQVKVPVRILWGENDPWEPIEMGRAAYGGFPCVDEFVTLPGANTNSEDYRLFSFFLFFFLTFFIFPFF